MPILAAAATSYALVKLCNVAHPWRKGSRLLNTTRPIIFPCKPRLSCQQCGYSNSRPAQDTHAVGCCQWLVKALVALAVSRWWWCSSSWCTSAGPSNQQSMKLCLLNLTVARNTPPTIHWHGNTDCAPPHLWSSIMLCPCLRLAEQE